MAKYQQNALWPSDSWMCGTKSDFTIFTHTFIEQLSLKNWHVENFVQVLRHVVMAPRKYFLGFPFIMSETSKDWRFEVNFGETDLYDVIYWIPIVLSCPQLARRRKCEHSMFDGWITDMWRGTGCVNMTYGSHLSQEVWPHLLLFQGCGMRRSRVPGNPVTVVNDVTDITLLRVINRFSKTSTM